MPTKERKQLRPRFIKNILSKIGQKTPSFIKSTGFQRWCILIVLSLFTALLSSPGLLSKNIKYKIGDIAEKDIKASRDFFVEDYLPTERKRAEAARAINPVYDLNTTVFEQISKQISLAFNLMREKSISPDQRKQDFETLLGITHLPDKVFSVIEKKHFTVPLEKGISNLVQMVMQKGILSSKTGRDLNPSQITISNTRHPENEERTVNINSILSLKEAQKYIENQAKHLEGNFTPDERHSMAVLAQKLIQPNLTFNRKETENRQQEARLKIEPIYLQLKKGEIIVREGERIQEPHLVKLRAHQRASRKANTIFIFLGSALLSILILKTLYSASLKRIKLFVGSNKNLLFLCALLAFILLASKTYLFVVKAVSANIPHLDPDVLLYALPVACGAMLVSLFFSTDAAIIFALPASILVSLFLTNTLELFIYFFVGSIIASYHVSQFKERGNVLKAGLIVGIGQVLLIIAFSLSKGSFLSFKTIESISAAFLGGCLLGVIVIGLIPIVEIVFGYTTNFKLLELASLDHPLLQELMVQAPGTYHHSVIVGSMVESAARAIGANPLLAKVSAYYHDVGKINKPAYFIENQTGKENKHEKLAPSMSSLILISHVRDGVELAKRYRLGAELIDIIRQHHGTSLISYFYEKAKKVQQSQSSVRIEDFRYPGPIPQTKEAGLVMLADAVEAASRTINDPTPARIKGMVQKIINNIFADGQLNDCELTLKDMHQIAKSFTHILTGIFHQRIEYPESAAKGNGVKKTDADSDQQQTKNDKDRPSKDKEKSGETLRRLGAA